MISMVCVLKILNMLSTDYEKFLITIKLEMYIEK